jgi:hypothetical protein
MHPALQKTYADACHTIPLMSRQPVETDFKIEVSEDTIVVHFLPTRSVFTFTRFTTTKDIAEFGGVSPDPVEQHTSRRAGTRSYNATEVRAMAFRLATEATPWTTKSTSSGSSKLS